MQRGKPLKRTPMPPPASGLRRRTALQRQAGRESLSAREGSKSKSAPKKRRRSTVNLRAALLARSGGACEMNLGLWCLVRGIDPCHRIGTGMGGRHGDAVPLSDRLSNAVYGCRACHDWTHQHVAMAKAYGLILPNSADPLREPVLCRYGVVWLDDDGGWKECPPATARDIREVGRRQSPEVA